MVTHHQGIANTKSIEAAYREVFSKKIIEDSRVIHYTASDFKKTLVSIDSSFHKSGQYDEERNWVLASVPRALPAAEMTQALRTLVPKVQGAPESKAKIKIFTHFDDKTPAEIKQSRISFIQDKANLNNHMFSKIPNCTYIKEIVFMEQLMDGEDVKLLHWEWQAPDPSKDENFGKFIPYVKKTEEEVTYE